MWVTGALWRRIRSEAPKNKKRLQNSWRRPSWAFPNAFQYKTWQPAAAKKLFLRCNRRFLSTYLHVGTSYRQWHSPHLGLPDTYLQGKMPLKKRNKTGGNAVSFLFSLEDGSAASTSSFPLPACHEPPLTERLTPGGLQGAPKTWGNFLLLLRLLLQRWLHGGKLQVNTDHASSLLTIILVCAFIISRSGYCSFNDLLSLQGRLLSVAVAGDLCLFSHKSINDVRDWWWCEEVDGPLHPKGVRWVGLRSDLCTGHFTYSSVLCHWREIKKNKKTKHWTAYAH